MNILTNELFRREYMAENIKMKDDEIFCPECGEPIKKGFFTCANCKIKVRLTKEINKEEEAREKEKSAAGKKEKDDIKTGEKDSSQEDRNITAQDQPKDQTIDNAEKPIN